ncbi:type VII secretion system-associated protein [Nocardia amamiensis]|uniref:type VII secretion system-associated protein n=1 Tax=Nocardia amamiensis TaxID=404578 RepID=UPI0009FC6D2B|nr:type VII secretion system-associated protein [Nocardia amamiensis]
MTQPAPEAIQMGNWFVLLDPAWQAETPDEPPPPHVIAGGWRVADDGTVGPFEPNSDFEPSSDTTPTDPTDAILRRIARGEPVGDDLIPTLRHAVVEIACDGEDLPLIGDAPDGVACVLVATSPLHRRGGPVDRWRRVRGRVLPDVVPHGLDILLNPAGPAPFRLITEKLDRADDSDR